MMLSRSKSKIVGVQLGEAALNFVHPDRDAIQAKFALLSEDGPCGSIERTKGWSEAALQKFQELAQILEADVLEQIFEPQPASDEAANSDEPPQF